MTRFRRGCLKIYASLVFLIAGFILFQTSVKDTDIINVVLQHMHAGLYFVTKIPVGRIYLYSAVANPNDNWTQYHNLTINAWDGSQNKQFDCCISHKDGLEFKKTEAQLKNAFGYSPLEAKQFSCLNSHGIDASYVSLVQRGNPCSVLVPKIPVYFPTRERGKVALCAKIAYGTLEPQRLIEWFEYQRFMGVDKVLVMVQYLNKEAYDVFLYYQRLGFVEINVFPSKLPGKVYGHPDRGFEEYRFTLPQASHDKQVGVYHCQEMLQGYDFVGIIDFDEFIIHDDFLTYKDILEKQLLPRYPDAAGFTFNVSFFILDWGETGSGDLYLTKHVLRTEPRFECYKNIYIPSRISEATTHTFTPKDKFKRYFLTSHNTVMHHYRECPKVQQWKNCMREPRTRDVKLLKIRNEMENRVKTIKKHLKLV